MITVINICMALLVVNIMFVLNCGLVLVLPPAIIDLVIFELAKPFNVNPTIILLSPAILFSVRFLYELTRDERR